MLQIHMGKHHYSGSEEELISFAFVNYLLINEINE